MGADYVIVPLDKTDPGVVNSEMCVMLRVNSASQSYPCACHIHCDLDCELHSSLRCPLLDFPQVTVSVKVHKSIKGLV